MQLHFLWLISKDFSIVNMKRMDYIWMSIIFLRIMTIFDVDDILDIHKYLMKKRNIK